MMLIASLAVCQAANAQVAMTSNIRGRAEVQDPEGWKPIRLMQKLYKGARVRCDEGAVLTVVFLKSGNRFRLDSGQSGVLESDSLSGGKALAGLKGASSDAAKSLGGSRVGALLSRAPISESRLNRAFKGWLRTDDKRVEWIKRDDAALYCFTIFDHDENVIWSVRTNSSSAEFPEGISEPPTARPYVWRLSAFTRSGKMIEAGVRWGALTFLTAEQEEQLLKLTEPLLAQVAKDKTDAESLLLLAAVYREMGVSQRALETLSDLTEKSGQTTINSEQISATKIDIYRDLGRIALLMSGHVNDKETKK